MLKEQAVDGGKEEMKKTILAIGVITLFICMAFVPAGASIQVNPSIEETSGDTDLGVYSGVIYKLKNFTEVRPTATSLIGQITYEDGTKELCIQQELTFSSIVVSPSFVPRLAFYALLARIFERLDREFIIWSPIVVLSGIVVEE